MGRLSRTERRTGLRRPAVAAALAGTAAAALLAGTAAPAAAAAGRGWERPAMSVPQAQAWSKGDGVTVAVIDTGVRADHPLLRGRASNGPDFLHEHDQDRSWYGGHGTAMASNVLEVAPHAKVLGLRAIRDREDPKFATWKDSLKHPESGPKDDADSIRNAIDYAVQRGAKVISMSLGDDAPFAAYDEGDAAAVQYALARGVTVVASAGNAGDKNAEPGDENEGENNVGYPAAYPGVLAVAATQPGGSRASFSTVHNYVDVAAPGVAISSADSRGNGRAAVDGTSPAGALTAGVAALMLAKNPKLSPAQVAQVLKRTAAHPRSYSPLTGYGQIDAAAAVKAAASVKGTGAVPVGTRGAGVHFGPGDDGTPARLKASLDRGYLGLAAGFGVPGLLAVIGGILLIRRGGKQRRAAAVNAAAAPPF